MASLTAVVFQIVRHQILNGDGLPLSILTSGFTFTKLRFFLSPSLFMNLEGRRATLLRSLIILYIIFLGLVALLAGPASAILLIPRTVVSCTGDASSFSLVFYTSIDSKTRGNQFSTMISG